jgi:hypothetical protein
MPTLDGEQFKLYHGTAGVVEGGELQPGPRGGVYGRGVYSTPAIERAEGYARASAERSDIDPETREPDGKTTRPLFGTVYEIDDKNSKMVQRVRSSMSGHTYLDPEPVKVKDAVSFPPIRFEEAI